MQTSAKWWNKWWDHFFQPQKPNLQVQSPDRNTPKQLPVFDLRIQLLGPVKYFAPDRKLPDMNSPRYTQLLAYFAQKPEKKIRRDELIGQFWPEVQQDCARNSLNVALCHIRRHFRKQFGSDEQIIVHQHGFYRLNPDWLVQTDVQRFEQHVQQAQYLETQGDPAGASKAYRKAVQLYRGDLLSSFPYEEWIYPRREKLKRVYLNALAGLGMQHIQRGEHLPAEAAFHQMLSTDPYLERGHQLLMWCYAKTGQRDRAIRQYLKCRQLLKAEFGLEVSAHTQQLYQCIIRDEALQTAFLSRA